MSYSENKKSERIQKILARAGIASRRKCEELITEGSVTVNGKAVKLGDKAIPGVDAIKVNGKLLQSAGDPVYLAFYKPRAVISMLVDNENRPNLSEYLTKIRERVFPIGRLDFNSEGLILLTNDGDFAEKIQKDELIPRVYTVKVKGIAGEDAIKALSKGARIDYQMVRPHSVRKLRELENKTQLQIVIKGGGAIDLRGLLEMKGLLVDKITRTAIGHVSTKSLAPGQFRQLTQAQAMKLLEQPELGYKIIDREIEADKPRGQRNVHIRKGEDGEVGTASDSPRPLRKSVLVGSAFTPKSEDSAFKRPRASPKWNDDKASSSKRAASGGVRRRGAAPGARSSDGYGLVKPPRRER
jgi:pseudouridine synthase